MLQSVDENQKLMVIYQETNNTPRKSVSEKLAAAECEARAAGKEAENRKRVRGAGQSSRSVRSRRRSTLTDAELDELMGAQSK